MYTLKLNVTAILFRQFWIVRNDFLVFLRSKTILYHVACLLYCHLLHTLIGFAVKAALPVSCAPSEVLSVQMNIEPLRHAS